MLKVEHLSFSVSEDNRENTIVDDVSFEVADGEMVVITGPNGGGKSTLAKVIMGIEKATCGKIFLDNQDITDLNIDQRANAGIGFAFQQPPRFKGMTVRRFLSLSAGTELNEEECCGLLSSVGLCAREYVNRQVDSTLSGGEMKRLEIASAMAKSHKLCIFDEPEAGIDLWSFSMLVKQFEKIHKEKKESILLISHQERIIKMADRIMVLKDGKINKIGKAEEVMPKLFMQDMGCACAGRQNGFQQ
ncbi:MAG: ATP-binding cassette domain-containing protein [Oscillospiraceae bacterium]|nr:ATP-binding cassette domain-containing protein [Oscillospiraceae bacterium]